MRHLLGRNITAFAAFISSLTIIPLFAATRTDPLDGATALATGAPTIRDRGD